MAQKHPIESKYIRPTEKRITENGVPYDYDVTDESAAGPRKITVTLRPVKGIASPFQTKSAKAQVREYFKLNQLSPVRIITVWATKES